MDKMMEVPKEMRDFAERSVSQARKAFEGYMGALQKTTQTLAASSPSTMAPARDMSEKAVSYAQSNMSAAFDVAEKLVHAKNLQEVMAIQTEYLKAQMAAFQSQSQEFGAAIQSAAVKK